MYLMSPSQQNLQVKGSGQAQWLGLVLQNAKSLHHSVVEIIVHDSRVIQIEKTERVRLDKSEFRPEQT